MPTTFHPACIQLLLAPISTFFFARKRRRRHPIIWKLRATCNRLVLANAMRSQLRETLLEATEKCSVFHGSEESWEMQTAENEDFGKRHTLRLDHWSVCPVSSCCLDGGNSTQVFFKSKSSSCRRMKLRRALYWILQW
jgi:hypothetical protein